MNVNDGESCPGAASCSTTQGKPLNRYPDTDEQQVCSGCKLVGTKPENIDRSLVPFVAMATGLAEIQAMGGHFQYPDGLTVVEWETLRALQRGRDKADKLRAQRDAKKK